MLRQLRPRRAKRIRRVMAATAALTVLGTTGAAWEAKADPPNCQTVLWGFLGSQRRTICDSPVRADGSWWRKRLTWSPAHWVPLSCWTSGGIYSSLTTCSGGYQAPYTEYDYDEYPVNPEIVLPDEPGHLG